MRIRPPLLFTLLIPLAGCLSSPQHGGGGVAALDEGELESGDREMGPPPPGYWRILGDAVPGWRPSDSRMGMEDHPVAWTMLGPRPMTNEYWSGNANAGGRVVGIAAHPSNANVVYIATASGGVWKTTDAGLTWSAMTDELSNLNHGAIAIDPSNPGTVYAGTGEYTIGSGGDGLFRSTDAGATWMKIATTAQVGNNTSRIVVHPTDPNIIHVTGSSGYVRSTNGGATWSTRLSGACSDLALDATNPQNIYVGRHSDGIYKSIDGGTNLIKLTTGLPATGLTRIILAISASNPSVVYATLINTSSGLLGQYKTGNAGSSWTQLAATPNFPSPQGWYDCCAAVDPSNENIVYAGGVFPTYAVAGIIKTTNGGTSWTDITIPAGGGQVHPDMQAMAFGPDGTLWVGCDGGVWKSTNAGNSWINCNAILGATQHYAVALHPTDTSKVTGGTQDNGTAGRDLGTSSWPQVLSGDGGFCAYDRTTPTRRYLTYVYLKVYRHNGTFSTNITGPWGSDPADFIAPLIMDPNSTITLLGGTNRVWRTTNAVATTPTWTAISPNIAGSGVLTAIAVATGDSNTIYAGSSKFFATTDAANWIDRSAGLPGGTVSDILISPTSTATAFVSVANSTGARVLRTTNSGANWTDVTGTLPSGVRAKSLEIDWRFNPPVMYVGTGVGIYWSFDAGATWTKDGTDFPNVNIGDLQIDRINNTITVGTYGRGVWRTDLFSPSSCYPDCNADAILSLADFGCFQTKFALQQPYADCNADGLLNLADFGCFQAAFALGCP